MWVIRESGAPALCGFCGFVPHDDPQDTELLYGLAPGAWGRGYATESARAVLDFGFRSLGLRKITASTDVPNVASVRVIERLGMRFLRRAVVNGLDLLFYEMAAGEWTPAATGSSDTLRH
jgi:ribosomal-protein-alanine N-acetyltransferase